MPPTVTEVKKPRPFSLSGPHAEVFVVHEGRGVYTVDGVDAIAEPGDVVVLPANAWHYFRGDGEVPLRHVAVLDSAHPGLERKTT